MAKPSDGINLVGCQIFPIEELGLAATVTSVLDVASTVVHTGCPATIHVISKLSSGSGTIKIDRNATSAGVAYGSADKSLSVSGTSEQSATLDTTSSELYFGVQQTSASTAVWSQLAILVLYYLGDLPGIDFKSRKHAINACMNSTFPSFSSTVVLTIA